MKQPGVEYQYSMRIAVCLSLSVRGRVSVSHGCDAPLWPYLRVTVTLPRYIIYSQNLLFVLGNTPALNN